MRDWTITICRLAIIAALAVAWELSGQLRWIDPDFLPPLSKVLAILGRLLRDRKSTRLNSSHSS